MKFVNCGSNSISNSSNYDDPSFSRGISEIQAAMKMEKEKNEKFQKAQWEAATRRKVAIVGTHYLWQDGGHGTGSARHYSLGVFIPVDEKTFENHPTSLRELIEVLVKLEKAELNYPPE